MCDSYCPNPNHTECEIWPATVNGAGRVDSNAVRMQFLQDQSISSQNALHSPCGTSCTRRTSASETALKEYGWVSEPGCFLSTQGAQEEIRTYLQEGWKHSLFPSPDQQFRLNMTLKSSLQMEKGSYKKESLAFEYLIITEEKYSNLQNPSEILLNM